MVPLAVSRFICLRRAPLSPPSPPGQRAVPLELSLATKAVRRAKQCTHSCVRALQILVTREFRLLAPSARPARSARSARSAREAGASRRASEPPHCCTRHSSFIVFVSLLSSSLPLRLGLRLRTLPRPRRRPLAPSALGQSDRSTRQRRLHQDHHHVTPLLALWLGQAARREARNVPLLQRR